LKTFFSLRWFHPLLLLVWIVIGAALRFTHLTGKPPWTDEFATLVFSLGNSFQTVPLDQPISLETLLQPLLPKPGVGASAVLHHLFTEDHHPPLYFVLAHWWMQLFPASEEYISLGTARSLPALFGVASIPAVYGLAFLGFRSRLVAQLAAAMIAVSPFGIFLAQEARHYALGILWVIASLCCLVVAMQHLKCKTPLPIWVALCWVVVNSLGMATHYFFSLTICAEAMVLIGLGILGGRFSLRKGKVFPTPFSPSLRFPLPASSSYWWRIYAVAAGTLVGCLVWVPVWQASASGQMTQWIRIGGSVAGSDRLLSTILTLINPIFQAFAAWITMLFLLPVEASSLVVAISSGAVMLVFFLWVIPILYRGLKAQFRQPDTRLATSVLGGFVLGAIALFFGITYFLGIDLTRGARYNFVYFPAVTVLLAAAIAVTWNASEAVNSKLSLAKEAPPLKNTKLSLPFTPDFSHLITRGKRSVAIIWLMSLLSGITVVSNLGYQKYYRPDLLVPAIQQASAVPVLIATTHNTLVQTGEMMGIAWEFKRAADSKKLSLNPKFLLAHQDQDRCVSESVALARDANVQGKACRASTTLQKSLAQLPRPLDLWLVNFKAPVEPDAPNCFAEDASQYQTSVNGYSSRLYHCLADGSEASRRP